MSKTEEFTVPQRGLVCRWCRAKAEAIFAKWDKLFRRFAK